MITWCIKIMLSQSSASFVYIDAVDEVSAVKLALRASREGEPNPDDFAQVGVFYTDHMLHEEAKKKYVG